MQHTRTQDRVHIWSSKKLAREASCYQGFIRLEESMKFSKWLVTLTHLTNSTVNKFTKKKLKKKHYCTNLLSRVTYCEVHFWVKSNIPSRKSCKRTFFETHPHLFEMTHIRTHKVHLTLLCIRADNIINVWWWTWWRLAPCHRQQRTPRAKYLSVPGSSSSSSGQMSMWFAPNRGHRGITHARTVSRGVGCDSDIGGNELV